MLVLPKNWMFVNWLECIKMGNNVENLIKRHYSWLNIFVTNRRNSPHYHNGGSYAEDTPIPFTSKTLWIKIKKYIVVRILVWDVIWWWLKIKLQNCKISRRSVAITIETIVKHTLIFCIWIHWIELRKIPICYVKLDIVVVNKKN